MTTTIVSLGSALQDIYLIDKEDFAASDTDCGHSVFGEIHIGSKIDIDRITYEVGGGGTNAAVTFARHLHHSIFVGNIGKDMAGESVISCLKKEGVDTEYISTLPRKNTGCSVIMLDVKSGERTILTHRGASAKFDNLDENILSEICPEWIYATTVRGDMELLKRFFKKAKKLGAKIMFNPGKLELKNRPELIKMLKYLDVLLLNKTEAAELLQVNLSLPVPTEGLMRSLARHVKCVIITDGKHGAAATDGKKSYQFGIYEDLPVKDTTGAGDAFGSGFLARYAAGAKFKDALIFGAANSTSVVNQLGAKRGIITSETELHDMEIKEI